MVFDLAVIGGGPAGYHAAQLAAVSGLKTVLFEKEAIGGTCMNRGCIPAKVLLHSARLCRDMHSGQVYGVSGSAGIDHASVIARKDRVVKALGSALLSMEKRYGVSVVFSAAKLCGARSSGFLIEAGGLEYSAKNVICACGSKNILPNISGLQESMAGGWAVTSDQLLNSNSVPESLTIIGGGVIGIEFASYFSAAGTRVSIIEAADHIGGDIDSDLAVALRARLEEEGISVSTGRRVYRLKHGEVHSMTADGRVETSSSEMVLICVGRRPDFDGVGIESLGLSPSSIAISNLSAGVPGIYFIGDCNGRAMLAGAAYTEAEVAVDNIRKIPSKVNYDLIPSMIFTSPELACVGLTEEKAKSRGLDVVSAKVSMNSSGRYMAENERGKGIIKAVAEVGSGRLLGVHAFGDYATEFILAAEIMVDSGYTANRAARAMYPHPTDSEAMKAVFEELAKKI